MFCVCFCFLRFRFNYVLNVSLSCFALFVCKPVDLIVLFCLLLLLVVDCCFVLCLFGFSLT